MQDAAEAGQMSLGGQALAICSAHPALKNTSATSIARSSPSRCRSFKPMTENSPSSKAGKVVTSSVMVRSISRRLSKGPDDSQVQGDQNEAHPKQSLVAGSPPIRGASSFYVLLIGMFHA